MKGLRILHTADLHMDSPFEGLGASKASVRRGEQRDLLGRIAALAAAEQVDLVLFSGDLLDSDNTFYETGEELIRALRQIRVPVFIAPGNHDFYSERSPYARLKLPENIHIFTENEIRCVDCGELGFRVYGAAFTDRRSGPLLRGFHAERTEGVYNILCLHGEVGVRDSIYDPISEDELARSGVDYAALGHVHKASGLCLAGSTWYSWPGCPEGRGFDETGEKTLNLIELEGGNCTLRPLSVASRRYETMEVDISDQGRDGRAARSEPSVRKPQRILLRAAAARRDAPAAKRVGALGRRFAARAVPPEAARALRRREDRRGAHAHRTGRALGSRRDRQPGGGGPP